MRGNTDMHTQQPLGGHAAIVAAAAHELKAPLTLISYLAQMLDDDSLGLTLQDRAAYVQRLKLVSQRTLRLVQHLTFSYRLEQDEQLAFAFPTEPVNVTAVCEAVMHELSPYAKEYRQTLQLQAMQCSHNAVANRDILYDIVVSLVDNAIRHSAPGSTVVVRPMCQRHSVRLLVHDNGVVIQPTDLARLRKTVGREPQPMSGHSGTSGLGLYIAQQLAQAMGGKIGLGRPEQGTTFFVDLLRSHQLTLW